MTEFPLSFTSPPSQQAKQSPIAHRTGRNFTGIIYTTNAMDRKGKKVATSPPSSSSDSPAMQPMTQEKAWASIFKVMKGASNTPDFFYNWARDNRTTCHVCKNAVNPDQGRLCPCTQRYCMRCLGNLVRYLVACDRELPDEQLVANSCINHRPEDDHCCRFCCLPEVYWTELPDTREDDSE